MLKRLAIRDFVLVDRLELEFAPGFGALTGETGAGKSILLDALSLLLGNRADSALVRQGCERAEVSGVFAYNQEGVAAAWLRANDLPEDEELLVRRVVEAGGRSRAYVNGTPVTAVQLKDLGEHLADIHGQHAHHALLRADAQRELLDVQAGAQALVREVGDLHKRWAALVREREAAEKQSESMLREREMLEWQLGEARTLAFDAEGWQQTNADHQRLAHVASLIEGASASLAALDDEPALTAEVERLGQRLTELAGYDAQLAPLAELLVNAGIQLEEASSGLRRYCDRIEQDPDALAEAERRIGAVTQFARKYRVQPEEILALQQTWELRLGEVARAGDIEALRADEATAQARFRERAGELSRQRTKAAKSLGLAVSDAMQTLAMAGGKFEVHIETAEPSAHGLESIEFRVAANAHQTPRALAKVASGGELSRIGLAIQVIASRAGSAPTLVFDEVDVGIGGRVAEIVGRHLKALGVERQVLVVTHLPQVAAQADWQWQVSKGESRGSVRSMVQTLDREARIEEIARMLGGVDITETTRAHAAELLGFA
ncbi:DNA repair protein RecN [Niveibacterium sp. SC-1]|uniref:DNA repair protein RecN n=1 Tax=Niveibacterium sp. SC-1 TaxID=3135646 RepID=UPI00311DF323